MVKKNPLENYLRLFFDLKNLFPFYSLSNRQHAQLLDIIHTMHTMLSLRSKPGNPECSFISIS